MNVADLYNSLQDDMNYVERRLEEYLECSDPVLLQAATHLLKSGGKRLRPVFVLLAGKFGDYDRERLAQVAVGLELIHMATLVHDDVIDHAETRRGNPTVKAQFGNRVAMFTGDFIFSRALSALAEITDAHLHKILAGAIERMCVGEIEQIRDLYSLNQSIRQYLRRIRRKTAFLIEMSCTLGAIAANAPRHVINGLRRYGYYTGMAFQITDDILDFTSTAVRLGKPVGSDLRQGNITAPVLYTLQNPVIRTLMESLVRPDAQAQELDQAIDLVKGGGGIQAAQALADRYLIKANEGLATLPAIEARLSLAGLAMFVGKRDH